MELKERHLYEFGPFRLEPAEHLLLRNGQAIPLAPKVFDTLLVLVQNSGHLVDKDELLRRVWPDTFVEEGNLTKNIFALRKILEGGKKGEKFIETIPKLGYRFVAPVKELREPTLVGLKEDLASRVVTSSVETARDQGASRRSRLASWRAAVLAGLSLALILAVLVYMFLFRGLRDKYQLQIDSLAVLPLANLSGDPTQDYFADGMTEALIAGLAKVRALRVTSRTSVMQYKGTRKPLLDIAHELDVDAIVEGTVQRFGQQVKITTRLIHMPTERLLWTETYERDLGDILALQSEIARAVIQEVQINSRRRSKCAWRRPAQSSLKRMMIICAAGSMPSAKTKLTTKLPSSC